MDDNGKLVPDQRRSGVEATRRSTYDNAHGICRGHDFTPTSMTLYVDGSQVAQVTSGITEDYTGCWTVGYTTMHAGRNSHTAEWDGSLSRRRGHPSALSSATVSTLTPNLPTGVRHRDRVAVPDRVLAAGQPLLHRHADSGRHRGHRQEANDGTTTCLWPAARAAAPCRLERLPADHRPVVDRQRADG